MADQNFMSMQQEAIKRVEQMKQRSKSYVSPSPPQDSTQNIKTEEPANPAEKNEHIDTPAETANGQPYKDILKSNSIVSGLKDALGIDLAHMGLDNEKIMLALLIYILYKNNADIKLLIALAYILL